jgi:DNA-binding MarR family transcriptional regulator
MAQTVAELQAAGFIGRRADPDDRRQMLIELTVGGGAELRQDRARREGWLAHAIATRLSPEEQSILARAVPLIDRLCSS